MDPFGEKQLHQLMESYLYPPQPQRNSCSSSTPPPPLAVPVSYNWVNVAEGSELQPTASSSLGFMMSSSTSTATKEMRRRGGGKRGGGGVKLSTDPQSVAARQRRHRISDRFKLLKGLVPGGSKMDTVSMLEEAINYVKFLKAQICFHQAALMLHPTPAAPDHDHLYYSNNNNYSSSLPSSATLAATAGINDYSTTSSTCNCVLLPSEAQIMSSFSNMPLPCYSFHEEADDMFRHGSLNY